MRTIGWKSRSYRIPHSVSRPENSIAATPFFVLPFFFSFFVCSCLPSPIDRERLKQACELIIFVNYVRYLGILTIVISLSFVSFIFQIVLRYFLIPWLQFIPLNTNSLRNLKNPETSKMHICDWKTSEQLKYN